MTIAKDAAPQHLTNIQHAMATNHGMHFVTEQMGGNVWNLVHETPNGAWVINGDYGVLWFPGSTRNDEDAEAIRETYFDDVEYDDDDEPLIAPFAAWAAQQMAAPDATESETDRETRARHEGHAAGIAAHAEHGDLRHSLMTDLAIQTASAAFPTGGPAVAIYGMAFVNGYTDAQLQAA